MTINRAPWSLTVSHPGRYSWRQRRVSATSGRSESSLERTPHGELCTRHYHADSPPWCPFQDSTELHPAEQSGHRYCVTSWFIDCSLKLQTTQLNRWILPDSPSVQRVAAKSPRRFYWQSADEPPEERAFWEETLSRCFSPMGFFYWMEMRATFLEWVVEGFLFFLHQQHHHHPGLRQRLHACPSRCVWS